MTPPSGLDEGGRDVARELATAGLVHLAEHVDRLDERRRRRRRPKLEGLEQQRRVLPKPRVAGLQEGQEVEVVGAGQRRGLLDGLDEVVPGEHRLDRLAKIASLPLCLDHGLTDVGVEADFLVDRLAAPREGLQVVALASRKDLPEQLVVHHNRLVGQVLGGLEQKGDERGHAPRIVKAVEGLALVLGSLARKLRETTLVDGPPKGRVEPDLADVVEAGDESLEALRRRTSWWLLDPGEPTRAPAVAGLGELTELGPLQVAERVGEALIDPALGLTAHRPDELFDGGQRRQHDSARAQLVQGFADQDLGQMDVGRQWEQPLGERRLGLVGERREAIDLLDLGEVLLARVVARAIVGERFDGKRELPGDVGQGRLGHRLVEPQRPSGEAQVAKLDGAAEPVVGAAVALHEGEVVARQRVVPGDLQVGE